MFGSQFTHIHLIAPKRVRKARCKRRHGKEFNFEKADSHDIEQKIDSLKDLAGYVIENTGSIEMLHGKLTTLCKLMVPKQGRKASAAIRARARKGTWLYSQLEVFTFDEFKHFLNRIGNGTNIGNELASLRQPEFENKVRDYSKYVTLKLDDVSSKYSDAFSKWKFSDWDEFPIDAIKTKPGEETSEMERYLLDRRVSKHQY